MVKKWMKNIPKKVSNSFRSKFGEEHLNQISLLFLEEIYHSLKQNSFKSFNFFWRERLSKEERRFILALLGEWIDLSLKEVKRFRHESLNESQIERELPKEVLDLFQDHRKDFLKLIRGSGLLPSRVRQYKRNSEDFS